MARVEQNAELHPYAGALLNKALPSLSGIHSHQGYYPWAADSGAHAATRDAPAQSPPERHPSRGALNNPTVALADGGFIVGDPGGGKSSALQMLIASMCRDFKTGLYRQIPVRISASDISMDFPLSSSLSSTVNRELFLGDSITSPAFFKKPPILGGTWHLIVDGLDEILSSETRRRLVQKLKAEAIEIEGNEIVVTVASRLLPVAEMETIRTSLTENIWVLQPFGNGQSIAVMRDWFKALGREDLAGDIELVASRIRDQVAPNLLNNPLMLSMVCQLICWDELREIPRTRIEIYAQFVEALQAQFFSNRSGNAVAQIKGLASRYGKASRRKAENAAAGIYKELGEISLDWLISDTSQEFSTLLSRYPRPHNVRSVEWDALFEELLRRTGIAVKYGEDIRFLHQTIADYLAAWSLEQTSEANDRAFSGLTDSQSYLPSRHSFIRFALSSWIEDERFVKWILEELRVRNSPSLALVSAAVGDGISLPDPVKSAANERLIADLHEASLSHDDVVGIFWLLDEVANAETISNCLHFTIANQSISESTRLWALVALAGKAQGTSSRVPSPKVPDLDEVELAIKALLARGNDHEVNLIGELARDAQLSLNLRAVFSSAIYSRRTGRDMGLAPSSTYNRVLLPRIYSQAQRSDTVDRLVKTVALHDTKADIPLIKRAYAAAEKAHEGQKRKSGEPYITHPVAVAQILADLGIGSKTIAAALLHDTVEDTDYTLDLLQRDFGDEIAVLVDGVTKLDKLKYGDSAQAETVRKMVVAMSKDIRVLVIKLADRLHNARTWGFVEQSSAARKAQETLEIYAPLAHRLGIQTIGWELEDLSFSVLYPKLYVEIEYLVKQRTPRREQFVENVIDIVKDDLKSSKIKGSVAGRPKQYYSIYQDMIVRGREFDEIYDLVSIRILANSVRDCYAALGSIHSRWNPIPGQFNDYIATPKPNLYQSLHTTVIGPQGVAIQIKIRTHEMHKRAEFGVASHWKYKERESGGRGSNVKDDGDMAWLAHISDWQADTTDPDEFLESLRFEIGAKEVYVFTPKGRVIGLPAGATPIDFAYAVHTEVGHRTIGAKVNGRLVPLESTLNSGDSVEIFTSKNHDAAPSQDWVNFVKTNSAKRKIRSWFTKQRRDEAIEQGKDAIAQAIRKQSLPLQKLIGQDSFNDVAAHMRYKDVSSLYAAVGQGHMSTQSVIEKVLASITIEAEAEDADVTFTPQGQSRKPRDSDSGAVVRGAPDILVTLAKCCTPAPGEEIVGFVTRGSGVSVHRSDCINVKSLLTEPERMIDVDWAPSSKSLFLVQIQVEALDRSGLLSDVTRVLTENHVNILSASVSTSHERLALSKFVFEMGDTTHLDRVLNAVRRIDAVYDVYRVNSG